MHHFFAYLSRMKYIRRWGLMRNTCEENIQEHSLQVAMIAHALALLHNTRFGGSVDAARVMELAVYHDANEVLTGDLPTPVKYASGELRAAYGAIEDAAGAKLLAMLPRDLQPLYEAYFVPQETDKEAWRFVKAADRICAYVKCVEEIRSGNYEFEKARDTILASIENLQMREAEVFLEEFVPGFSLTLDELNS